MNIKLDIDATPEELRTVFGLPDVQPLQQEMLEKIRERMAAGMDGFDPFTLMKPFLPEHLQSLEAMQRQFWQTMANQGKGGFGGGSGGEPGGDKKKG